MKHVIIIADGAGDKPLAPLGGKTPLEYARTPNLDRLARMGRVGTAVTTPPGFEAGSDVCSMDLLGFDPRKYHTGRAPLEAAALGLALSPTDWIFRLNLVTVGAEGTPDAGLMLDHSAGAITDAEARELVAGLLTHWRQVEPGLAGDWDLHPGVSYRNILIDHNAAARTYRQVRTVPPHEIPRQPWADHLPGAAGSAGDHAGMQAVRRLMDLSRGYLAHHPVNTTRVSAGKRPANMAWIWGQGTKPAMPLFKDRFGLSGAMITAVDLLRGIAALMGWERLNCSGITSYHDTDYRMQGLVTCQASDRFDVVCCHVESPDEASHQADWKTKVAGIEAIDELVVGPVLRHLESGADAWRLLVMPDHYTLVSTRKHDATPPPFAAAGAGITPDTAGRFTEAEAGKTGWVIEPGDRLMNWLLDKTG